MRGMGGGTLMIVRRISGSYGVWKGYGDVAGRFRILMRAMALL